jgi:ABC-type antimicrobial peptide transport system permease subunit
MDEIVDRRQEISDEQIARLVIIEAIILGIIGFVFFIELLIIIPKLILSLRKAGLELRHEAQSVEKLAHTKLYTKLKKGSDVSVY